ncbi:MAG TPA: hypothetical protein VIK64_08790 [Anaerolineales bacterium]
MSNRIRPFWLVMATANEPGNNVTLTCDECFAILDQLASLAIAGADDKDLKIAVRSYLAHCPDCEEYYEERIEKLEAWLTRQKNMRPA